MALSRLGGFCPIPCDGGSKLGRLGLNDKTNHMWANIPKNYSAGRSTANHEETSFDLPCRAAKPFLEGNVSHQHVASFARIQLL